jgi:hypothetical protein
MHLLGERLILTGQVLIPLRHLIETLLHLAEATGRGRSVIGGAEGDACCPMAPAGQEASSQPSVAAHVQRNPPDFMRRIIWIPNRPKNRQGPRLTAPMMESASRREVGTERRHEPD